MNFRTQNSTKLIRSPRAICSLSSNQPMPETFLQSSPIVRQASASTREGGTSSDGGIPYISGTCFVSNIRADVKKSLFFKLFNDKDLLEVDALSKEAYTRKLISILFSTDELKKGILHCHLSIFIIFVFLNVKPFQNNKDSSVLKTQRRSVSGSILNESSF